MNKGGIFYGISVIIGGAGVLLGAILGFFSNNFFVALQTWVSAAILTLVFVFFANVLDSLDKISNQISSLKEDKAPPHGEPAHTESPMSGSAPVAPIFQDPGHVKKHAGTNEWACPQCGKINQNYVGTCGCGSQKP